MIENKEVIAILRRALINLDIPHKEFLRDNARRALDEYQKDLEQAYATREAVLIALGPHSAEEPIARCLHGSTSDDCPDCRH